MSWYEELDRWTADYLPDMIYEHDAALAKYTSFRIGGPARRMAFPQNAEQLVLLLNFADQSYLSRFFKKNTGMSPKEFRLQKLL